MPLQALVQDVYSKHAVLTCLLILLLFFPAHLVPITLEVGLHSIMTTDQTCSMYYMMHTCVFQICVREQQNRLHHAERRYT